MRAGKRLLLTGLFAVATLAGCKMFVENPPAFEEFQEAAEWKMWHYGYEDLEYQSHEKQQDGWRYHFNYNATKGSKDYELGVSCYVDDDYDINSRITSRTVIR